MRVIGGNNVAAELGRVAKSIDSTALSADRTAVAVENLDRTLLAVAGAMDKEIAAASKTTTSNKALGDSFKFVAVSSEQSVAGINASTAALDRHSMAATTASGKMRAFVGSATASGLIKASKYIAGGALVTGYESINKYMSFQRIVTQSVTEAGVPLKDQKAAMSGLLDISTKTGAKADDIAHVYYRVASSLAGTHTPLNRMLKISEKIAELNLLGNVPSGQQSEETARVVMSMYNANLKDTGHNLKKTIGTISAIAGSSDAYIKDVSVAFGNGLLAAAQQQGLGMNEAGSIFAAYTKLGMKPASAGVYATRAITQLFSPTIAGSKGFGMLGIDAFKMKKIQDSQGFGGVLKYLNKALEGPMSPLPSYAKYKGSTGSAAAFKQLDTWFNGSLNTTFKNALGQKVTGAEFKKQLADNLKSGKGMTEQDMSVIRNMMITRMFGGQRGSVQIAALLNNLPSFMAAYNNINANSNNKKVDQLTEIARQTPGAQLKIVQAKINADFIKIGEIITPMFLRLAKAFAAFFDVFAKFKPLLWEVVGVLGEVLVIGIALKSLRGAIKIFDFFKALQTKTLRDALTNTKATEPLVAAGTAMERAATVEMEAATMNLRAAEMSVVSKTTNGLMLPGSRGPAGKGLYLPGYSYPGRKPIGRAYAETTNASHAAASSVAYINQGAKSGTTIIGGLGRTVANPAATRTVAQAAVADVAKVGFGSAAKTALGAVGRIALGPEAQIAMMLAPIAIPLIGKLFGGIGSLFGGGPGATPTNAPTLTEQQKQAAAAAALAAKQKNAALKGGIGDVTSYLNSIDAKNVSNMRGDSKNKWAANNFAYLFENGTKKQKDKLAEQLKNDPAFAAYIKKNRAGVYGAIMGYSAEQQLSKNKTMQHLAANQLTQSGTSKGNEVLKAITDPKNSLLAKAGAQIQGIYSLSQIQKKELTLANKKDSKGNYVLNKDVRAQYTLSATTLGKEVEQLRQSLSETVKAGKASGKLNPADLRAFANETAAKQSAAFKEAGLSADQIGKAVARAISGLPPNGYPMIN